MDSIDEASDATERTPQVYHEGPGRTDLLLRLFDSSFFDEWMAVSYLHKHSGTGIEDYICNRLYDFPEAKVEKYLPQLCIILVTKRGSSLERLFNDLCSRSLRIAVKGYWLLTSFLDDFQKNESQQAYIRKLCSDCCDAALGGHWEPPFKEHLEKTHRQARLAQSIVNGNGSGGEHAGQSAGVDQRPEGEGGLEVGEDPGSDSDESCGEDLTAESPEATRPSTVPELPLAECSADVAKNLICSPLTSPRMRKNTFAATLDLFEALCEVSARLATLPEGERQDALVSMLEEINTALESPEAAGSACILPMSDSHERVLRIPVHEARLLNSREKVPFMLSVEVVKEDASLVSMFTTPTATPVKGQVQGQGNGETDPRDRPMTPPRAAGGSLPSSNLSTPIKGDASLSDLDLDKLSVDYDEDEEGPLSDPIRARSVSEAIDEAMTSICGEPPAVSVKLCVRQEKRGGQERGTFFGRRKSITVEVVRVEIGVLGTDLSLRHVNTKSTSKIFRKSRRVPSQEALKAMAAKHNKHTNVDDYEDPHTIDPPSVAIKKAAGTYFDARSLFGETFATRKFKLARNSIFGGQQGWSLKSIIVKAGDDCRQELMAVQLITEFHNIFLQDGLRAWLRPIKVLVTSSHSGLIETVTDAHSIHSIKCKLPKDYSLSKYFDEKYGKGSRQHYLAKRNFVESMAGYSIVSYLLQIKDRHNANILLDEEGHVVHIDFGFMLSNSPGGINFETAPFKLTREFLEVMDSDKDGKSSELFDYFKILCIQTFLTCRKHADRILNLVEMMQLNSFPCFSGGHRVISALKRRFQLSATEEQCIDIVLNLISDSMDAWRTRQYDYYQRVLNGIL